MVYAKPPFGGPERVLEYLGRYTHRVAISNHRLLALEQGRVTFQWKDYRSEHREKSKTMTLAAEEFQRRFLIHTLPAGFQRIRHYGLLANAGRREHLAQARELLQVAAEASSSPRASVTTAAPTFVCPHCGSAMRVME